MFVFDLTKKTKDAFNILNPNDYLFSSRYNTFKILAEGNLTNQTVNSNPKTFSINHGIGYAPNFYAFCEFPDGKVSLVGGFPADRDTPVFFEGPYFMAEVDSSSLYFIFTRPGANYNVNIKWYIFEAEI